MSLAPRLDLRQSQSLVMTPQLQQAIRLLALSNLEIEGFIAEEIEKNPLLEAGPTDAVDTPEPVVVEPSEAGGGDGEAALDIDTASAFENDSPGDRDGSMGLSGTGNGAAPEDGPDLDGFANPDVSLADHLLEQAGAVVSGADMFIAAHLIDQIDEAGYLTAPLLDMANRLGVPLARVERVLAQVQTLDPTGVGARSLAECIALQAKEADRYDPAMAALIDNLDLLARGERVRLKRICGVDDEDLNDMIRELRDYDPKPGCRYGGASAPAVVPDIFITKSGAGWRIELNSATLPRVLVNR
ncbi:MAG TPA: RNA polymerase sigma-54 factor, partial [Sphingomonas sp.]|nr:RNA polymerase sigma-54 factor [Sphingomonas sp.]